MKNLFLSFLAVCCLGIFNKAQAQVDVTLNPIGLLFGDLSVGADFALSESFSIEGTVGFGSGSPENAKYTNIPINAVAKYYFNPDKGADKFYGDVWLRFISRKYTWDDATFGADYTQTRFGLGFGIGYKVVGGRGIVFDIGLGGGTALSDNTKYVDSTGTQTTIDWPKLMILGKLGIGWRFGGGGKK